MKRLTLGVLLAALLPLGFKFVGRFAAGAGEVAPGGERPRQTAAGEDRGTPGRDDSARTDKTGPNRTRRGDEQTACSRAPLLAVAKPADPCPGENGPPAAARVPPPVPEPQPRSVGPDGVVFRRSDRAGLKVGVARALPPPGDEPPAASANGSVTAESAVKPPITPARGKMVGPDGIEFRPSQRLSTADD